MVNQTKINGREKETSSAVGVGRNLFDLIHDLMTLVELQSKLLAFDLSEVKKRIPLAMVLIVFGGLLALATFPIALLAIGWALVNLAGFSQQAAFGLVGIVALVVALATVWIGFRKIMNAMTPLERSRREFQENVKWVKGSLLKGRTRPDPRNPAPRPR